MRNTNMTTLDDKASDSELLNIAKRLEKNGVPIIVDEHNAGNWREIGNVIAGPAPSEIRRKHPENFTTKLYVVVGGLEARQVEIPCAYAGIVSCYFTKHENAKCPIAPLCKAYEKY
ncbi:MAG: hypothetical protein NTY99_02990 [DPANN group archaeon]|nr:hypothetical protein [DPANN group archaeon]